MNNFIKYKKYKDILDMKKWECWVSLIFAFVMATLYYENVTIRIANISEYIEYLDNIGIALIGFLGFIITGLALMISAIPGKIIRVLKNNNVLESLERILLSFYLIGLTSITVIISTFCLHFISLLPLTANIYVGIALTFVLTYLISFTLLYALKLISNCIELFSIVNSTDNKTDTIYINCKDEYNNIRLAVLEQAILKGKTKEEFKEYKNMICDIILNSNMTSDQKEKCMLLYKEHFNNKEI